MSDPSPHLISLHDHHPALLSAARALLYAQARRVLPLQPLRVPALHRVHARLDAAPLLLREVGVLQRLQVLLVPLQRRLLLAVGALLRLQLLHLLRALLGAAVVLPRLRLVRLFDVLRVA